MDINGDKIMSKFAALVYLESNPSKDEKTLCHQIDAIVESYEEDYNCYPHPSGFNYDYWYTPIEGGRWDIGYEKPILAKDIDVALCKKHIYAIVLNADYAVTVDNDAEFLNVMHKLPTMNGWVVLITCHS